MIIMRKTEIPIKDGKDFMIGDQITLGEEYTATCQKIGKKGSIFLFDQYLDDRICMYNEKDECFKYEGSKVRKFLLNFEKYSMFDNIREYMVPFKNGDLLRIPTAEEIFDQYTLNKYYNHVSNKTQWKLMKDKANRIAFREKDQKIECGWLQGNDKNLPCYFAIVTSNGDAGYYYASDAAGVRPVFRLLIS